MLAQGLGLAAAFGVLIALPQTAAEGVRSGLTLCGQVILPSLFPFFVCSNLFVLLGFSARVSAIVEVHAPSVVKVTPRALCVSSAETVCSNWRVSGTLICPKSPE